MLLLAKILLTLSTLGYSLIPAMFDSNSSHATNPSWTGHARYHVVWQVSSYVYVALIALYLIWFSGSDTWPLWIAVLLAAAAYGGFWTAAIFTPVYGGKYVDEVNGVPPFKWGKTIETDANVTIFTVTVVMLLGGVWALLQV